jgi:hypothetical protein
MEVRRFIPLISKDNVFNRLADVFQIIYATLRNAMCIRIKLIIGAGIFL